MAIYGIGTDICDVRRIKESVNKNPDRLAKRVLAENEYKVWQARSKRLNERGIRYLATRFSAKESFSKAVGLGITSPMQWRLCEIANHKDGKPFIILHGQLKEWFENKGLSAHISITDESDYAASFCVVEKS